MPPVKRSKHSAVEENSDDGDRANSNAHESDDINESDLGDESVFEQSGSEGESSLDTEDEIAEAKRGKSKKTLKRKRRATDAIRFGATLQSLLSTDAPSTLPLSLKPSIARKRNDEKLDAKGKKILHIERKGKEERVVKLFNVIQQSQSATTAAEEQIKAQRGTGKPTLPAPSLAKDKKNSKQKGGITRASADARVGQDDFLNRAHQLVISRPTAPLPFERTFGGASREATFSLSFATGAQHTEPSQKVSIRKEEWERRLHDVQVTKEDLNRLVMDYLVIEGFKSAAEEFSREAGIASPVDLDSIESRMNIREALQRGDVSEAIELVNDLNPEILDTNPALYFRLQQQKLIEYIRQGNIPEALEFAQEELAPRGEESPEFLSELEKTMALLAFDSSPAAPSSIMDLLSPAQRLKTAGEVNAAILESLSQGKTAKLVGLLKLLCWAEGLLDEKADYPKLDLSEGTFSRSGPAQFKRE
ncbi:hypothetical protein NM688_g5157 [Phlebia brevispora]|uniref:Uncharacterized protein n=1 Tax=Phlebia brevispora TaxID=194682 RepID=A0ACC1SZQ9_9APHY|nr:hypothetical protein NM688_g5157 [Phlebia brevispora]